jgi:hypothetical protein
MDVPGIPVDSLSTQKIPRPEKRGFPDEIHACVVFERLLFRS